MQSCVTSWSADAPGSLQRLYCTAVLRGLTGNVMVACDDNTGWPAPIWCRGNVLEECVPANIPPSQEGEVGGGGGECHSQAQYLRGGGYLCRGVRLRDIMPTRITTFPRQGIAWEFC